LNGVQEGSIYTDTNNYLSGNGRPIIGINAFDQTSNPFNGFMDEIRLSRVARWTANFTPPTQAYRLPADGLEWFTKLLWHCEGANGATVVPDSSNVGHYNSYSNASLSTAQAKFGASSLQFAGTSYVYPIPYPDLLFYTNDFTIEFWFRTTSSAVQVLIDYRWTQGFFPLIYLSGGNLFYHVNSTVVITGTTTTALNTWYHVALCRSGTVTKLYLNGVQEGASYTDTNNYGDPGANRPLFGITGLDATSSPFQGFMDEIRITRGYARYTANFTPPIAAFSGRPGQNDSFTKFLLHFGGPSGTAQIVDSSPSAHPLISGSGLAPNVNTQKKFGLCSGSFAAATPNTVNSNDSPASADWVFGTGDFTLEAWVFLSDARLEGVIDFVPGGANGTYPAIWIASDQTPAFAVAGAYQITTSTFIPLQTWHHVAVTRAGNQTKMFLDGVQVGSTYTDNNNYVGPPAGSWRPIVGLGGFSGANGFNGYMDEVRISKGIARWTANFTPPAAPYA
jgi:hypothetical protein